MVLSRQKGGPNFSNVTDEGTGVVIRPNVTEEESTDPDYIQQALVPMDSETHSGAGKHVVSCV